MEIRKIKHNQLNESRSRRWVTETESDCELSCYPNFVWDPMTPQAKG